MKAITNFSRHVIILVCLLGVPAVAAAAPVKMAILPFTIQAGKDPSAMQKNIVDLLTFRLSAAGEVEIVGPEDTAAAVKALKGLSGDSLAVMAGAKLQADYVLHGSVTARDDKVMVAAALLNVTGNQPPLTFSQPAPDAGAVIPVINRLANDIIAKGLSMEAAVAAPAQPRQPASPRPMAATEVPSQPPVSSAVVPAVKAPKPAPEKSTLNPAFVPAEGRVEQADFWKSADFNFLINGLAVGDVNKDGLQEAIMVTPDKIIISQKHKNQMRNLAAIDSPSYTVNIAVDVADINANGTPEIFVTALNSRRTALASYVIEFDGAKYKTIVEKAKWYFRVIPDSKKGHRLVGQAQKIGQSPFGEPIMDLRWKGGQYTVSGQVLPGGKANALGFVMGDVTNDGTPKMLVFDEFDHLRLLTSTGERIWTGKGYYGGSPIYYSLPPASPGDGAGNFYLPVRLLLADLDRDGNQEAIVPHNIDTAFRKLAAQRFYTECQLSALQWDGLGVAPIWETRKLSGRMQDIAVADLDNDGTDEIVAAVITSEGAIVGTNAQSALIAFELNQ